MSIILKTAKGFIPVLVAIISSVTLLMSETSSANEYFYSAFLESEFAVGIDGGDTQKLELIFKPKFEAKLDAGIKFTAIGRFRLDAQDKLEYTQNGDNPSQNTISQASKRVFIGSKGEAELREFYLEIPIGKSYLTIGKQQIVWGKTDGLKILDVVNPQSFREFILDDFEDSRIPLWSANLEVQFSDNTLQLLLLTDQSKSEISETGSSFAFTSPRVVPTAPPHGAEISIQQNAVTKPSSGLNNADVGLRWSGFQNGWDYSLNYLYHYDDLPTLYQYQEDTTITIDPKYERSQLFGGTFTKSFGDITLRGELAYSANKHFLSKGKNAVNGIIESDQFLTAIGLDYSGITDTTISGQIFNNYITDYSTGVIQPENDTTLSMLVRRNFNNDTLKAEMLWLANSNDGDGLIKSKLTYDVKDNVKAWIGSDIFYGTKSGLYGQFKNKDRILLGMEVGF